MQRNVDKIYIYIYTENEIIGNMLHETFDNCNECIKFQRDFIVSSHLFNFFFKKKVFILNNFLFSLQNLYRYSWMEKMEYIIVYNFQVLTTRLAI